MPQIYDVWQKLQGYIDAREIQWKKNILKNKEVHPADLGDEF